MHAAWIDHQSEASETVKTENVGEFIKSRLKEDINLRRSLEFECAMCNAQFGLKSILNEHIAFVHDGKTPFQCHICGEKIDGLSDMNFHLESKHEQRRYEGKKWFECGICRKRYDYKA